MVAIDVVVMSSNVTIILLSMSPPAVDLNGFLRVVWGMKEGGVFA